MKEVLYRHLGKGRGYKRKDKYGKHDDRELLPSRVEDRFVIEGPRMAPAEDHQENDEGKPADIVEYRKYAEAQDHTVINPVAPAAEHRIHDMPPVELADGQEIERRHEEADPTRICEGMEHELVPLGNPAYEQRLKYLEEKGLPELHI